MTTEPIRPELLAYLRERRDEELLAGWPVQPTQELLPALRSQLAPAQVQVPRREVTLFTPDPIQQTAVEAQRDIAIACKRAATGVLLACGGLGFWLAGMGVHEAGLGIHAAGIGLWAIAAIFLASAVSRVFAPKRGAGAHVQIRGNNNRIRF